jgi:hypothetical protein
VRPLCAPWTTVSVAHVPQTRGDQLCEF